MVPSVELGGMTYEQVLEVLGEPASKRTAGSRRRVVLAERRIRTRRPGLEFIEFGRGRNLELEPRNVDIFATPAGEVVSGLVELGYAFQPNTERGHTFVFEDLQVGFWRASMPESPGDDQGRCFDAVGIGRRGYYH